MFKGCFRMPEISIEGFDLQSIETMEGMFSMEEWVNGKTVNIENGETISVTANDFKADSQLKTIVFGEKCVGHPNMKNADNVGSMFKMCIALERIYVWEGTTYADLTNKIKNTCFEGDVKLIGGGETVYDNNNRSQLYAKIGTKTSPG